MAKASIDLIQTLRKTAKAISRSHDYQWGHMGACNCGFLAQQVTALSKREIHSRAMEGYGDWAEQVNDYCPTSGLRMDNLISALLVFGFDTDDLKYLERLSDPAVLRYASLSCGDLKHNNKQDVVRYVLAWAEMLEDRLIKSIDVTDYRSALKKEIRIALEQEA